MAVELQRPADEGADQIVVFRQQNTHYRPFAGSPGSGSSVDSNTPTIGQFAPGMACVHAVADDKIVRTGKPNVISLNFGAPAFRLVDHHRDRRAAGAARHA